MSVAWTTLLAIVLLLPGVSFFIGISTLDRRSREVIRASAVGEIALAVFVALVIHVCAVTVMKVAGFNADRFFQPLVRYADLPPGIAAHFGWKRLTTFALYVLITAAVGYLSGLAAAGLMIRGHFRQLVTHRTAYNLLQHRGFVTAYVLTTTSASDKHIVYKGVVEDFYLNDEGQFSYIVLSNCQTYFLTFDHDAPQTGPQRHISPSSVPNTVAPQWNYFVIDGSNIANVLFDRTSGVKPDERGLKALEDEYRRWLIEQHADPDQLNLNLR